jgi:hypothetical protein
MAAGKFGYGGAEEEKQAEDEIEQINAATNAANQLHL